MSHSTPIGLFLHLRADWPVHIGLDVRLREGAGVGPHLVNAPAEEVVIGGSEDPRADLESAGDGTERYGLRRAGGSPVEVPAKGRAVGHDGHVVPDVRRDRVAERAL